jgi:aspartate carbamoyltransferase catalytic subunit
MKHFLQMSDLTRTELEALLMRAEAFKSLKKSFCRSSIGALLFYENSTRTRISFELAAHALNLKTINLDINTSSVNKGESIFDTLQTLGAMGCQYFVIRHSESGLVKKMADLLGNHYAFINAGDGTHAHPTQGLLDMLTIYQNKKRFDTLKVGILGDSIHSRVAKSDIAALHCLGCRDIRLIGPKEWLIPGINGVSCAQDEKALDDLDVIITLRVQKERMNVLKKAVLDDYIQRYKLTTERLKRAHPHAIVMHPGPINREVEIASDVADGSQSVILKQVRNGVFARMAVWEAVGSLGVK